MPTKLVRMSSALRVAAGIALACWTSLAAAPTAWAQTPYNSLTLLWTAPGDDGSTGQVSSYQLRYSTTAVGTDTVSWWNGIPQSQRVTLGPPLASAGNTDSTKVTGLNQGTTYYFIIRALDEVSNISGFSNVASGTTQSCNAPTSAPNVTAVADTGQVQVSWNSTSDPLAQSLNLFRAQGTGGPWVLYRNFGLGTTSFLDTSVNPGTQYRYRATWMGAICEGPVSNTASATTPGTPSPPSGVEGGATIHAYPNPSSGPIRLVINVEGTSAQMAHIKLYDLNGHWIATLSEATYPPGQSQITWNRTGRDGRTVIPGYYEILGTIGSTKVRERVILVP